jgi:hypothetical protein
MIPIVTFDFDSCLSRPDVQEYAAQLIAEGVNVWIVTSRFDDLHVHLQWQGLEYGNNDLFRVADKLGITRDKIRFTNMVSKSMFLINTKVIWHLDDDNIELNEIRDNKQLKTIGIQVNSGMWKQKCQRLLKKHNNYWKI